MSYGFFYIPDINNVPFEANILTFIITFFITGVFIFWVQRIYRLPTSISNLSAKPAAALGGWLIILMIILFGSAFSYTKHLFDQNYFSLAKWEIYNTGIAGIIHKAMLIFELASYVFIILYSLYCLFIIFKRRDIAPHYLKIYFLITIIFSTIDYLLRLYFKMGDDKDITDLLVEISIACIWTYYLNVSLRVRETFVIPYIQQENGL